MAQRDRITLKMDLQAMPLLAPFMIIFLIFIAWPVFYSLWISTRKVTIYTDFYNIFGDMQPAGSFGFANYIYILSDPVFLWSVVLTFYYAFLTIFFGIVVSLGLALALKKKRPGFNFMRTGFFLPNVFDIFVVGVIWLLLYNPNGGIISWLIGAIGPDAIAKEGVLNNPLLTLPAIAFAMILKNAGFGMILFLVSLHNMNEAVFEAADVDGASPWQKFVHITLPLLKPIILFLSVTGMVGSLNAFAEIFAMTDANGGSSIEFGGQTLQSARISAFHLFMVFNESSYGEAAAISFILLGIALVIAALNFKFLGSKD